MWLFCIICYLKPFFGFLLKCHYQYSATRRILIQCIIKMQMDGINQSTYIRKRGRSKFVLMSCRIEEEHPSPNFLFRDFAGAHLTLVDDDAWWHQPMRNLERARMSTCETLLVRILPIHESIIDFSSSKEEPLDSQQEEVLELLLFQSSNDDDSSGGNNEPTAGSNNHKETNSIYAVVEEGNNKTRADVDRIFRRKSIRSTSVLSMYLLVLD